MRALLLLACITCNTEIYVLEYQGRAVSFGDMNQQQCEELKRELEMQTQPFTELVCVPRMVHREEA